MITRRGLVLVAFAAVLSLFGFAYQVEEFVLFAVSAVTVIVVGLVLAASGARRLRRDIKVEIGRTAGQVVVGERAEVTVSVSNVGRRALSGALIGLGAQWHVSFPGLTGVRSGGSRPVKIPSPESPAPSPSARARLKAAGPMTPLPDVVPGGRWSTTILVPTRARGLLTLDPMDVWCSDPLGLVFMRATMGPSAQVVVCPDPSGELDFMGGLADHALAAHALAARDRPVEGDELWGLRAYVPGDRITRMHWPAVARTGLLMVRHFVDLDVSCLEVVVDVHPGYVEPSIRSAAVSGAVALNRGSPVVIRTTAGEQLSVEPGAEAMTLFLQALAFITPAG